MCSLMVALDDISTLALGGVRLYRSHVIIRQEPQDGAASGRFIEPRSPLPLFLLPGASPRLVEISAVDNPALARQNDPRIKRLLSLAPDLILRLTAVEDTSSESYLVGVWTEFTPSASATEVHDATKGLHNAINALGLGRTSAILIQPAQRAATGITRTQVLDYSSDDAHPTVGFRLAMNQAEGVEFLKRVLLLLVRKAT